MSNAVCEIHELESLTKRQLIDLITYEFTATSVMHAPSSPKGPGRKDQVLALITEKPRTIEEIAAALEISTKNVSSQFSYLRDDGVKIGIDPDKHYFLWK